MPPLDRPLNRLLKRSADIGLSVVVLPVAALLMILTAIVVKITSPGPVIFKQKRVGYNGKVFTMYKFRSMHTVSDELSATEWTVKDDMRKTCFGSFIRKCGIDELPQLLNVLKGEMSIIGPRPERPFFVREFADKIHGYIDRLRVKPGITGWAQVCGWRGDTSIEKRLECDLYYIENWTLWFDITILFLTLCKGLWHEDNH